MLSGALVAIACGSDDGGGGSADSGTGGSSGSAGSSGSSGGAGASGQKCWIDSSDDRVCNCDNPPRPDANSTECKYPANGADICCYAGTGTSTGAAICNCATKVIPSETCDDLAAKISGTICDGACTSVPSCPGSI
ncbi:MAG: hypothetical protein KC776_28945 [Myxococcales bacterium]|nr:hypothetical protein [Myxococcales bacterium]